MIEVYGMPSCSQCQYIHQQIEGNIHFEFIDIGSNVSLLKAFLRLRDNSPVFDEAKRKGYIGIPCFVLEDGSISLSPEEVGLKAKEATSCPIGHRC